MDVVRDKFLRCACLGGSAVLHLPQCLCVRVCAILTVDLPQLLGEFAANSKREIVINLFPAACGLHSISGLRVTDLISGRSYDIENLKDVLVLQAAAELEHHAQNPSSEASAVCH